MPSVVKETTSQKERMTRIGELWKTVQPSIKSECEACATRYKEYVAGHKEGWEDHRKQLSTDAQVAAIKGSTLTFTHHDE